MSIFNFIVFILSVGSGLPRFEVDLLGTFITLPQKQQETRKQMCNEGVSSGKYLIFWNFFFFILTQFQLEKNSCDAHGDLSRRARWMSCKENRNWSCCFICTTCWSFKAPAERGSGSLAVPSKWTMCLLRSAESDFLMSHSTLLITAANFNNQGTPKRIIYQENECQKRAKHW